MDTKVLFNRLLEKVPFPSLKNGERAGSEVFKKYFLKKSNP